MSYDTYLPAFRALVEEAKADSVMCAYNSVDGEPACANNMLLGKDFRGAWAFQGYVVSDPEPFPTYIKGTSIETRLRLPLLPP